MLKSIRFKIDKYTVLGGMVVMFLCKKAYASFVARTVGSSAINLSYILIFSALLFLYLLWNNRIEDLFIPLLVYFAVFLLFFLTMQIHPEYSDWFAHSVYGIRPAFLNPRAGIWFFLILWLYKDQNRMLRSIKLSAWIAFAFYMLQFLAAMRRGYWIGYDVSSGDQIHGMYNLEFGYDMLFPTAFMGAYAFLYRKRKYYIPYALGVLAILLGGSRGAVIWPVAMFPMMLPFRWRSMTKKRRVVFCILFFFLLILAVFISFFFEEFVMAIAALFEAFGFSSRTITSLLSGSFSDPNGRDQIYAMAIELIKNGGPFGHGVYGDRYVIGNYFKWGYSHNVVLELLVSFGYVGGSLVLLLLLMGILRLYRHSRNLDEQILFIVFLTTSMKLMLSNSFWYTPAFWALLVLMIKSRKRHLLTVPYGDHNQWAEQSIL